MNNENDSLALSEPSASREAESVRQSGILSTLPVASTVSFWLTEIRGEAQEHNGGKIVQGDGPWWMCTITPMIVCRCCHAKVPDYYCKAASHDFELSLALALSRLEDRRRMEHVEQSQPDASQHPGEANKKGL